MTKKRRFAIEIVARTQLPSAVTLDMLRHYAGLRRDASRSLAEGLRSKDSRKIRDAIALEKQSRELQRPAADLSGK